MHIRAARSGRTGARQLDPSDAAACLAQPTTGLNWAHVEFTDAQAACRLLIEAGLHPLDVESATDDHERPKLRVTESGAFLSAHALVADDGGEDYVEIGVFIAPHRVITTSGQALPVVERVFERWAARPAEVAQTPAGIAYALLDELVDEYFPVCDALEDGVDELTERVVAGGGVELADFLDSKRRLIEMRRRIAPLRDILNAFLRRDVTELPPGMRGYFQDVYDHVMRLIDAIDSNREVLAAALDANLASISNRLNAVMMALTVIATILMSAGLIAGIYGMNFVHMPELEWRAGYPFALALMVLVGFLELWFFRRRGWI